MALPSLCHRLGVSEQELRDPDARIPIRRCFDLWEHVAHALREPALPLHVIARKRLEHLRVLGFLAMTSDSGWEALERAIRYGALMRTPGAWSALREGGRVRIAWDSPRSTKGVGERLADEAAVAMFLRSLRLLAGREFPALEASFSHEGPLDRSAHETFFGCAVEFGGDYSGVWLDEATIATIVPPTPTPGLAAYLAEQAEGLVGHVDRDGGILGQTRAAIARDLANGFVGMPAIARTLGMHPRTLRRSLEAEGASFATLVDELRREQAVRLLRSSQLSITEIGLMLGFSETSAFTRAFRRWFGESPRTFRSGAARAP